MVAAIAHIAPAQPVSPEVLGDRYQGLLYNRKAPLDRSGLQGRMDAVLRELIVGTARVQAREEDDLWDDGLIDEIEATIRTMIVARIVEKGVAR